MNRIPKSLVLGVALFIGLLLAACNPDIAEVGSDLQGRVWSDDNRNGKQDDGEAGIPGVIVRLETRDPNFTFISDPFVTEDDGVYVFTVLDEPVSDWMVTVETKDGRLFTTQNVGSTAEDEEIDSDVNLDGEAQFRFKERFMDIDAGLLPPGAAVGADEIPPEPEQYVVSGFVYDDMAGNGLYDPGDGDEFRSGVTVELLDAGSREVLQSMPTNGDGFYRFEMQWRDDPVLVRVVKPPDSAEFSPPYPQESPNFPSSVDPFGDSLMQFDFSTEAISIHAGLNVSSVFATQEPRQTETAELTELYPIVCTTGEITNLPAFPGPTNPPVVDGEIIIWSAEVPELPADTPFCTGLDFTSSQKTTIAADPNNALSLGSLYSTSACVVNNEVVGIAAAQSGENGEIIPLSTAATASLKDGLLTIAVSTSEVGSRVTGLRPATSDLQTCILRRPLSENNAFESLEVFGDDFAQALASADGTRTCDAASNTCLMFSDTLDWARTGDQTADLTIDGVTYAVQLTTAAGQGQTRLDEFVAVGWALGDPTTFQTALRSWQVVPLLSSGATYGLVAVSENGSTENPVGFAVSILSSAPVPEAALETLAAELNTLLEGFRSAFELVE